jgi:hypothetical protein
MPFVAPADGAFAVSKQPPRRPIVMLRYSEASRLLREDKQDASEYLSMTHSQFRNEDTARRFSKKSPLRPPTINPIKSRRCLIF